MSTYGARTPSDDTTVATQANFVPMVVGKTDRDRSFSGVLAHDERSQQPRPEVHPEALNVLVLVSRITSGFDSGVSRSVGSCPSHEWTSLRL